MEVVEKSKAGKLGTPKVLIADDDPPTRILLRAAVSQWGYEVVEAKDGEEAWNVLQLPDSPKLLILDWLMPKLDGIALCSRIKESFQHKPFIILLTQVTGTTNIIKGLDAGADEFLSKPFNMAELHSRLSVGARIIQYGQSLAERNLYLEKLAAQLQEFSQQFNVFIKTTTINDNAQKAQELELENNLANILKTLNEVKQNKL